MDHGVPMCREMRQAKMSPPYTVYLSFDNEIVGKKTRVTGRECLSQCEPPDKKHIPVHGVRLGAAWSRQPSSCSWNDRITVPVPEKIVAMAILELTL